MTLPSHSHKFLLTLECVSLFGLIPGVLIWMELYSEVPFFPVLFGFLILTLLISYFDPQVKFKLHSPNPDKGGNLKNIFIRIIIAMIGLSVITAALYPELLFRLPREKPAVWLMIMFLYPMVSVAPQEFLFRSFFMQRYQPLFGQGHFMIAINAIAFAWAHAFFLNPIAPTLSLIAGILLATTWQRTRSFRLVCLEHALYGQIVFTCGIGWFFYQGSTRALQSLTNLSACSHRFF